MVRFADLNAQDRLFFAYDRALRRVGLPGIHIQIHLSMCGTVDVDGLKEAVRATCRAYPAIAGRMVRHPITGGPRWRLDVDLPDMNQVIQIHHLQPAKVDNSSAPPRDQNQAVPSGIETPLMALSEHLLNTPLHLGNQPPLRFHIIRGLPHGDVVVMKWPHAFMDVRGASLLLEEIEKAYQNKADPDSWTNSGDETRHDYDDLIRHVSRLDKARTVAGTFLNPPAGRWHDLWLPDKPIARPLGRIQLAARLLSPDQSRCVQEASMQVCGFARFGDFARACAIRAMHRLMGCPSGTSEGYSTVNMIDHRKRRQRGPVCHNLFSGLPMRIPAAIADNRRATAESMRRQTEDLVSSGGMTRHLVASSMISRLPITILSEGMYRNMCPNTSGSLPVAFGTPPSAQVGFCSFAGDYLPTFCGARRESFYGFGIPPPLSGFAVDLNITAGQVHITATYYPSRISAEKMNILMDKFVAGLLDPRS